MYYVPIWLVAMTKQYFTDFLVFQWFAQLGLGNLNETNVKTPVLWSDSFVRRGKRDDQCSNERGLQPNETMEELAPHTIDLTMSYPVKNEIHVYTRL